LPALIVERLAGKRLNEWFFIEVASFLWLLILIFVTWA